MINMDNIMSYELNNSIKVILLFCVFPLWVLITSIFVHHCVKIEQKISEKINRKNKIIGEK